MAIIRGMNLNGVAVAINFVLRRLQPYKERVIPTFEFIGDEDIAREVPEKMLKKAAYDRLGSFFSSTTRLTNVRFQRPYDITNPPPQVR